MYECKKCNYVTLKKSDWNKHIITKKHKKMTMQPINLDNNVVTSVKSVVKKKNKINEKKFVCENCGHKYKFRSGLSRHEMKCGKSKMEEHIDELKQTIKEQNDKLNHFALII